MTRAIILGLLFLCSAAQAVEKMQSDTLTVTGSSQAIGSDVIAAMDVSAYKSFVMDYAATGGPSVGATFEVQESGLLAGTYSTVPCLSQNVKTSTPVWAQQFALASFNASGRVKCSVSQPFMRVRIITNQGPQSTLTVSIFMNSIDSGVTQFNPYVRSARYDGNPIYPEGVIDFLSAKVFDASVTTIPGSASSSVQVVASLADDIYSVHVYSTLAGNIGLYRGPVATPTLVLVIPPGVDSVIPVKTMLSGDLISIRSLTASTIVKGQLVINFAGVSL